MDRASAAVTSASAAPLDQPDRRAIAGPHALAYRPDIDGLRAIAVLAVILFHADFLQCRGGFVGVDVFFVISGFLITSIIVAELDRGTFSLAHFYERRVRRIFPALFLMMAVCCVAGALLFDPSDLRYLGESVAATSLFASNILFWIQTGYFNSPADDRPLLHTWSLAVEEQFYVFFPLYLIITSKFFPRQRTNLTLALCGLSFVASAVAVRYQPDTAFYLAPMRAWELLLGALLALGPAPRAASAALRNLGTTLGVVMVLVACFSYSGSTSFPGVAALLPTVGTALIIWAGMEASPQANSLLGCRPLVFVGKISYSLYLWHFMLLGFVRYLSVGHPSVTQRLVAVLVAFALSCISWRYVEQLFRKRVGGFSSRTIAISGVAVTVVFLLLGAAAYWSAGFPARLHGAALAAANGAIDFDPYRNRCYMPSVEDARTDALCKIGAAGDMPVSFVLWGDSHAEAISSPLSRAAAAVGRRGVLATQAACPPLLGVGRPLLICEKYNDAVFDLIRRTGSITDVILESRWAAWSEGKWFQEDKLPILLQWHGTSALTVADDRQIFVQGFDQTLSALAALNKKVWIVGSVPEIAYNVPRDLYVQALGFDRAVDLRPTAAEFAARQKFVEQTLSEMARKYHAQIIYPDRVLCRTGKCLVSVDGAPLYVDDHHLSVSGANFISSIFRPIFQ